MFVGLPNNLPRDVQVEYFAEKTEKMRMLGNLLEKEVENMVDHGCPKFRNLVDTKAVEKNCSCSSYSFGHKTSPHYAESTAKMLGKWAMPQLKL